MTDIKAADIAKALKQEEVQESEYRSKGLVGAAEETDMIEGELVRVLIQRNDDRVATDVPEHEVEILKAIYSPENVEVLDVDAGYYQLPDDAGLEIARLKQKYDRRDFPVIQSLYPKGAADLASSLGMANKGAKSGAKVMSSNKVRAPERAPAKKASKK